MKSLILVVAGAAMFVTAGAQASEQLAQSSGCMTCHAVDRKVIGPSFKDVAAKYSGNKAADADLFKKVKAGGKGVWGDMPMPPNAHLKDEDIKTLVRWVLATK
jgi:cytochrome c